MSHEVWVLYKDGKVSRVEDTCVNALRTLSALFEGESHRSRYEIEGPFLVGEDHTRDADRFKEELRLSTAAP